MNDKPSYNNLVQNTCTTKPLSDDLLFSLAKTEKLGSYPTLCCVFHPLVVKTDGIAVTQTEQKWQIREVLMNKSPIHQQWTNYMLWEQMVTSEVDSNFVGVSHTHTHTN